ncbi:winged helix DNA-binding domain-containing protein [Hymenobacter sp. CRA2]|uniref:winged helix DNA-binding domain-containing protein n=1 Tax=Hymenobacter sp. CRA2 TaxID=1955620 RepID=UPI00098F743A|nr:winged helix DNA-binding domain-containing protein [Hymenobacter sp. CRA2]OON65677.1 hypothetical protein B0919_23670 [Hymenobacter sp. CRA2]
MTPDLLLRLRLLNQQVAPPTAPDAATLVAHLGAMQAQDYGQGLWAVGVRQPRATAASVAQALAERRLVRTWLLRGTLHLAAAADVRWLLALLAPRIIAACAPMYRQRELDAATISRSLAVLAGVLEGQPPQPRSALAQALQQAGIHTDGSRLTALLQRGVLEQLICPATRHGAEPTYALLDEWLPPAPAHPRPDAIAELARRYFRSHGPAAVADFGWWAGLPLGEARQGLEAVQAELQSVVVGGQTYWLPEVPAATAAPAACLLPGFDEYLLAYKDRSLVLDAPHAAAVMTSNGIFRPIIVVDGRVVGTWKRSPRGTAVELAPFAQVPVAAAAELAEAAAAFTAFWAEE